MRINTIIINQPFGSGDIIFCQSIANYFVNLGYKVIWPVVSQYAPLAKHFPNITLIDKNLLQIDNSRQDTYEYNGCRVIPLRFSDTICKVPYTDCMKSKYMFMGLEWVNWKEKCDIKRNFVAEVNLLQDLGLQDGEPYNLISDRFQTAGTRTLSITPPDNGYKNVYMTFKDGYTLIDWLTVMHQAATIHAVSSACIYLFELFPPSLMLSKGEKINLYIRRPNEQNHDNYSYLLTKENYILHG
jgi:hypothetical protein